MCNLHASACTKVTWCDVASKGIDQAWTLGDIGLDWIGSTCTKVTRCVVASIEIYRVWTLEDICLDWTGLDWIEPPFFPEVEECK